MRVTYPSNLALEVIARKVPFDLPRSVHGGHICIMPCYVCEVASLLLVYCPRVYLFANLWNCLVVADVLPNGVPLYYPVGCLFVANVLPNSVP